jgi:hypothetical protein
MLVVVRVGVGHGRHLHQLRAEKAQGVLLLLALRFGDHDQGAVAAGVGDHGKPDTGVAGCRFQDEPAGPDLTPLFSFQDDLARGSVFDRLAGIHELGLA